MVVQGDLMKRTETYEEIKPLIDLCKAGKLFDVQKWITSGKPVNGPRLLPPCPDRINNDGTPETREQVEKLQPTDGSLPYFRVRPAAEPASDLTRHKDSHHVVLENGIAEPQDECTSRVLAHAVRGVRRVPRAAGLREVDGVRVGDH